MTRAGLRDFVAAWMRAQPRGDIVSTTALHKAAVAAGFDVTYMAFQKHMGLLVLTGVLEKDPGGVKGYRVKGRGI